MCQAFGQCRGLFLDFYLIGDVLERALRADNIALLVSQGFANGPNPGPLAADRLDDLQYFVEWASFLRTRGKHFLDTSLIFRCVEREGFRQRRAQGVWTLMDAGGLCRPAHKAFMQIHTPAAQLGCPVGNALHAGGCVQAQAGLYLLRYIQDDAGQDGVAAFAGLNFGQPAEVNNGLVAWPNKAVGKRHGAFRIELVVFQ